MIVKREQFDELIGKYNMSYADAENACDFVHDLLAAEADLTEEKYPMATTSTSRLNSAAYQAFVVGSDIAADNFGEE